MLNSNRYLLGLTWLVAIFLVPFPFVQTLSAGLPAIYNQDKTMILFGTIAYSWMLLAMYISTRPKWLDRLIGLPNAYMIHGILSLAAIVLAYLHKSNLRSDGWIKLTGNWALYLFIGLGLYSMIFMAGWLTNRVPALRWIKQSLERVFKHEVSILIHRLNVVATGLIFIHVLLIPYIRQIVPFTVLFVAASLFVFGAYAMTFVHRRLITAKLINNVEIKPNVRQLTLKLHKHLDIYPGDFVFLSFPKVKLMKEPHPFSIVNAPSDSNELVLAIRGDGDFTRQLATIQVNESVVINGGFGMYQSVINENHPDNLMIIAGGIGIVPLLSIVDGNPDLKTTIFYSVSNENNLLYQDKFDQWEQRDNFRVFRQIGRFNQEAIANRLPKNTQKTVVLIGGPDKMGTQWIKNLRRLGVRRSQIYYERFSW
ncbi:FAD-binding oxidoreductase (plasmid) [Nicoliella spurrieriana]|uniref:FAD-binding oxidoreductase n=1 Tax=Nicoliella spurrieriana TaxID=2925830 RepID=A0A976RR63_9LACO|nr:FAD-binding oxidoreductase [Nicoliella spurrieriana]UQS86121.1 FAD-binding oxidoreductase [Nicoliella spurrieriana]